MDLNKAIEFAQLVNAAYAIPPGNLANSAGTALIAGDTAYTVVTTIYANDLATDMNPGRGNNEVSIGFVCTADGTGDVVIAIRGTEGIQEWINDAQFLLVACPFLAAAGRTEDGFTAMYNSLRTGDPSFVGTYDQVVKNSFRIANRLDLVPKLPLPPLYEHVAELYELNPIQ